jgi:hypothetical protein
MRVHALFDMKNNFSYTIVVIEASLITVDHVIRAFGFAARGLTKSYE